MKIKLIRAAVALAVLLLVGSGAIAQDHRITARELVAEIQKQVGVEWKADTVESPKFVETLPKVGYRFMSRVEWVAESPAASLRASLHDRQTATHRGVDAAGSQDHCCHTIFGVFTRRGSDLFFMSSPARSIKKVNATSYHL